MDYSNDFESSLFGGLAAFGIGLIILVFAILIVGVIANWKMYKKAGKGGWEAIVPFYGYWVLVEIAGLEWWWFLLIIADSIVSVIGLEELSFITNLASLFASFTCYYNIAKKFGKDTGTSVCAGIFSFIFICIFGFSKKEVYDANIPVSKYGIFGTPEKNVNNQNTNMQTNNDVQPTETVDVNKSNICYCANCGMQINKEIKYCPNCGKENN